MLFKDYSKWTENQKEIAQLLFEKYPIIQQAYNLSVKLYSIYQNTTDKGIAYKQLAHWYGALKKLE